MRAIFEQELEREQPDIVHFQHLQNWSLDCVQAARSFGVPVVYTLHEYLLLCLRGGQMRRQDGELCEQPSVERCADCIAARSLGDPTSDDARVRRAGSLRRFVPPSLRLLWRRWFPRPLSVAAIPETSRPEREAAVSKRLEAVARLAREVDLFISPSRFLRERFIASGLVRPEQIIHSNNGLDAALFPRRKPRQRAAGLRLGYIGTISEYKGLHVLVEAMAGLKERSEITCHVHGDLEVFGDYARSLRERAQALGIHFHGRFDNRQVGEILAGVDALVVPSLWYENSPLTIQEAFLAGLPVLASRLGGMAEFVRDGENGLLFHPGDAADLRRAILRLADEAGLLERLGKAATPVKNIQEDARAMARRYKHLIAGHLLESGRS